MIRHELLLDLTKIGRGEFGEVLAGKVLDTDIQSHWRENGSAKTSSANENEIQAQQQHVNVLVKSLSKIKDESFFIEFRRQIDLYRASDSAANVVKLLALSFEKDHHFMILEHGRDMKSFLMENPNTSMRQLIKFCSHVVSGNEYS